MPMTRRQYELGISNEMQDWMEKTYTFLKQYQDSAYTRDELGELLEAGNAFTDFEDDTDTLFDEALKKLVFLHCVEARQLYDTLYFAKGWRELEEAISRELDDLRDLF